MLNITYKTFNIPFIHPFTISKGTKTHQPTFIVEISWNGFKGYGEAPEISYYNIPIEKMVSDLESKMHYLQRFSLTDPERFWHFLHHLFPDNSFLVCALDMAGWDLFGKLKSKPLYELFHLDLHSAPITDITIGIDTLEKMQEKVYENPWPVYKIKAGIEGDLERISGIQSRTEAAIRVDINGGWDLDMAMKMIPLFSDLGIELIEQPLGKDDLDGMEQLYRMSEIPLIADETCVAEADVDKCIGRFHGINIKLTKCGGITPARRMIKRARALGLKTMLGCMCESSIGTSALAHLAPEVDYLDADGPLLLADDLATGLSYVHHKLIPSTFPGLGIHLKIPI